MENNEQVIFYTEGDLHKLVEFLAPHSPLGSILEDLDYDPVKFCIELKCLRKEWAFVYSTPLQELPLTMNDPRFEGWRRWRFSIGK